MIDRSDFLKSMYEQMFRDIAQAYTVVWQSAGTVFASFAIIALAEKNIVPIDLGISVIILLTSWFILNVLECSYWYNRNLCIIANIERQFLTENDLRDIQYYFGAHRPDNKMISHLRNQLFLGWGISALVLLYHFCTEVVPGFELPWSDFSPILALPYAVSAVGLIYVSNRAKTRNAAYNEFVANSPGIKVKTDSVTYGPGHGFP